MKWLNKLRAKLQNWDWDCYRNGPRNQHKQPLRRTMRREVATNTYDEYREWRDMGADVNVACKTCKKDYYCGHSSYGRMRELQESTFPKHEHEGHELVEYSTDWFSERNGNLESDFGGGDGGYDSYVVIEDFDKYEHIDLTKVKDG